MAEKLHPHSYKIIISEIRDGDQKGFEIYIPAFNASVFGDTIAEALEGYLGYFDDEVKRRKKESIPIPKPDSSPDFIKQIPLRIPNCIYQRISTAAKNAGHSFNSYVIKVLEEAFVS